MNDKKDNLKKSLNLPQTDLSITNKHKDSEAQLCAFWEKSDLYRKVFYKDVSKAQNLFVLHWGPPYANGHMHIGHVLTSVLKDMVVKFRQKQGYSVYFKPGWDCHGLPIENKIAGELGLKKEDIAKQLATFKAACRSYANKWIDIQKKEHQQLGIIADFKNYYSTMNPSYEAATLASFATLVDKGYLVQRHKTVSWCAACATVLAAAEIEYKDRKDPSIYLRFKLSNAFTQELANRLGVALDWPVSFLVWTTTPWTLPLNRAIICHPKATYVLVLVDNEYLIVGEMLATKLAAKFAKNFKVITTFVAAEKIAGLKVLHPIEEETEVPIVFEPGLVGLEEGTAIVHCAPGCGPEDYLVGIKNNLEIYSPVNENGCYTAEIKSAWLVGLRFNDALGPILSYLQQKGILYFKETIVHAYPHCWRCGEGLIFRATKQWFCDLTHNDLQGRVLRDTSNINFLPAWGRSRFTSFVGNRNEWCLSRQRFWGVPIVAFKCLNCGQGRTSKQLIDFVAQHVANQGIEYWDQVSLQELATAGFLVNEACGACGEINWTKESDILDVWFDSGVSHLAVLKSEGERLFPADLYLEGSDQHRGWFNSSLFTSMAINESTCTKAILTHGFVLDEHHEKMSKSKGNVIAPQTMIERYGADVLRAWVASSDYEGDVVVSEDIFKNCAEVCRKIRNTCRFMLANLFDIDRRGLLLNSYLTHYDWESLSFLDRYILLKLRNVIVRVDEAFDKYQFTAVLREINAFCTIDLSAGYLDMVKDTLYVEAGDSHLRRATQMTFMVVLDFMLHRLAPVLTFMAEEVYLHFSQGEISIFEFSQPTIAQLEGILQKSDHLLDSGTFEKAFALLATVRKLVFEKIERLREASIIKHPLEAKVKILLGKHSEQANILQKLFEVARQEDAISFLKRWLGVSQVELGEFRHSTSLAGADVFQDLEKSSHQWLIVEAEQAGGTKCPRCWQWGQRNDAEALCCRCRHIVVSSL